MNEAAFSQFAGLALTYLLRSLLAYALFGLICRFLQDAQLRFQLCGIFLGGLVTAWLGLLVWPGLPALSGSARVSHPVLSAFPWLWTVHLALTPRLATVLSPARWVYVVILTLLLLRFCLRFRSLQILLRASPAPPEALAVLFESVRSDTRVARCELRLVTDLRSPAATGWWRPRVLLPHDFVPRLETQQLVDILRHELMHVRRRDYLWDMLATVGCCLVFFHPAGWLVRRRLRRERELVCDEGVVEGSGVHRLEYATCLTTLATWRWLAEPGHAGPIDFLSSPSLLAARVYALVSPQKAPYSVCKKALFGVLAMTALGVGQSIVPEVAVTSTGRESVPRAAARIQESFALSQPTQKTEQALPGAGLPEAERPRMPKRHHPLASGATTSDPSSRLTPVTRMGSSSPVFPSSYETESQGSSMRHRLRWGLMQKVGTWTIHTVRFGVTRIGLMGGSKPQSRPSGEGLAPGLQNSTDPL
jgi:beta-lactamase regulating signal transducer with metallopeptidase domain